MEPSMLPSCMMITGWMSQREKRGFDSREADIIASKGRCRSFHGKYPWDFRSLANTTGIGEVLLI